MHFHFKCYRLILDLLVLLHFIDRDLSQIVFPELSHTNRRQVGELRQCSLHSNDTVFLTAEVPVCSDRGFGPLCLVVDPSSF